MSLIAIVEMVTRESDVTLNANTSSDHAGQRVNEVGASGRDTGMGEKMEDREGVQLRGVT